MKLGKFKIENYSVFVFFLISLLLVFSLLIYGGVVLYKKSFGNDSVQSILSEVGKLVELPLDEEPSIATVTDLSKLADQEFFSKAKVGDKLIIFSGSKKAILYRPSENIIVEIGPII